MQDFYDTTQYECIEEHKCPKCGEQRMDWLLLDDDDRITCQTCGEQYKLEVTKWYS